MLGRIHYRKGARWFGITFALTLCTIGRAQTNTENFGQLEFNFNNPGGRAAAMGGAFTAIADDATAAETNPAGLTALIQPEISFEIKAVQYNRSIVNFDAIGSPEDFTYVEREFKNSVVSPSFLSLVYPLQRVTFSVFRYELVNFRSTFFTRSTFVPNFPESRFFPVDSRLDMKVTNWGGAAAYKVSNRLSVGGSAGLSQIKLNSVLTRFTLDGFGNIVYQYTIDHADKDFFFNIGVIFNLSEKVAIGGILKRRPRFHLPQRIELRRENLTENNILNFNIPSSFGIGLSYRFTDLLTLAFDVVRINYSDLTDDFVLTDALNDVRPEDFATDDGIEVHAGGEYVTFWKNIGVVLRAGVSTEPKNSIRFVGQANGVLLRESTRVIFQEGDSDIHATFGLGILPIDRFQVDLAANLSRGSQEFVASMVYRL